MTVPVNTKLNTNTVTNGLRLAALLLLAMLGLGAQAQTSLSLQQAINNALTRNLQIKQAALNEAIDGENLKQARLNMLPSLSASPQVGVNFGRGLDVSSYQYVNQRVVNFNGSLSSQVVLFAGGLMRNQILASKMQLEVDKSNTAKLKNDLVLNVVTTYLSILNYQELYKASVQQVAIATETLDKVQKNFDVGNNTLADLSQAKATVATADLNQTTAQNQLDMAMLALKQYMEMDASTPVTITIPDVSKMALNNAYDAQAVYSQAVNQNPDVKLAMQQLQVAMQNVKVAQSNYYPTLSLFGSLGSNYSDARKNSTSYLTGAFQTIGVVSGSNTPVLSPVYATNYTNYPFTDQLKDNFNQSVGISLQIPLFNKWTAHTSVQKAKLNQQIAQLNAQVAKNTLNKTVNQAVLDYRAAIRKYASAQQTYEANKDAFNVTQQRYGVGLVNALDYNTSLTNLNKSEFDMIQARYEMIFRSKIIDYYLGNPITL